MKISQSFRLKLGIILVISYALLSLGKLYILDITYTPGLRARDNITPYEKYFDTLKKNIPVRGVVGYISDRKSVGTFYLLQYIFAPVLLDRSIHHSVVLANFSADAKLPDFISSENFNIKKDTGTPFVILERKRK